MTARPNASARGYGHAWAKAREGHLRSHPFCAMCEAEGRLTRAVVVDHVKPHRGDQGLFWDRNNWQSLCVPHHSGDKQAEEHRGYSSRVGADGLPSDPRHPFNRPARMFVVQALSKAAQRVLVMASLAVEPISRARQRATSIVCGASSAGRGGRKSEGKGLSNRFGYPSSQLVSEIRFFGGC